MTTRIRQFELAKKLGVTRQAVRDLVRRGVVTVGDDGLIDAEDAERSIALSVRPSGKTSRAVALALAPAQQSAATLDYHQARALREHAEAQRATLKLRQEQGELASRDKIERMLRSAIIDAREYLLSEPPRLAVLLDGMDRKGREDLLRRSFEQFLRRIAEWERADPEDADAT